jgi:hypothetical protein
MPVSHIFEVLDSANVNVEHCASLRYGYNHCCGWDDNIKMDIMEIERQGVDWF